MICAGIFFAKKATGGAGGFGFIWRCGAKLAGELPFCRSFQALHIGQRLPDGEALQIQMLGVVFLEGCRLVAVGTCRKGIHKFCGGHAGEFFEYAVEVGRVAIAEFVGQRVHGYVLDVAVVLQRDQNCADPAVVHVFGYGDTGLAAKNGTQIIFVKAQRKRKAGKVVFAVEFFFDLGENVLHQGRVAAGIHIADKILTRILIARQQRKQDRLQERGGALDAQGIGAGVVQLNIGK